MKKSIIVFLAFAIVIGIISVGGLFVYNNKKNAYSGIMQQTYTSVYEKLVEGEKINILVVGDSIGQGTGATNSKGWASMLPEWIEEEYSAECNLTNISMGGNTTYAGIIRTKTLDDDIDYDLVIICFGENDSEDKISSEYEALIRTIQSKYGNASIISVLESSQREYTNKISDIIKLADYYGIPVADTIYAFGNSGYEYEELVNAPDDLVHPNDKGHEIYLDTIKSVIQSQVNDISICYQDAYTYDDILYYDKKDMHKTGSCKYELVLDEPITADIGLYRNYCNGENGIKIYADGELVIDSLEYWDSAVQGHVYQLSQNPIRIESNLTIEFSSKELAQNFYGLVFTNIEQ